MNYINKITKAYPVTEHDIRAAFPDTSFPVPFVPPEEYALVFPTPRPVHNTLTHSVHEDSPELTTKGTWEQQWEVSPLSDEQVSANLATAREQKWDAIKTERDRRKYLGVNVGDHWFHSDDPSRIQQLALAMMGTGIPAGLQWKTLTKTPQSVFVEMTPALASGIFQATAANDAAIFAAAEVHRLALEASDRPDLYTFDSGWPASFEDV